MSYFGLLIFLVFSSAYADLTFWSPVGGQGVIYVLPGSMTPELYLQKMKGYPGLAHFTANMKYSNQDGLMRVTTDKQGPHAERTILVANKVEDHENARGRINNFSQHFEQTFVYPVGAALGLNIRKEEAFHLELAEYFGTFTFMGGKDKDPSLYGEPATWSVDTNRLQDVLEERLIRFIYFKTQAKIFGVCRGLQHVFTALGGKLEQDITLDLNLNEAHEDKVMHPLVFRETKNNLIRKILMNLPQSEVLSVHHQAARISSVAGTVFEVAATSPMGVVEALESRDQRIILVQFHPEMPENRDGYSQLFFKGLKTWSREPLQPFCKRIFQ